MPAILTASLSELTAKLKFARETAEAVQLDVMDGSFTAGRTLLPSAWPKVDLYYSEAHLMVADPYRYLAILKEKGIIRAIVHVESDFDLAALAKRARELDLLLGFAINQETELDSLADFFGVSRYVQVMAIIPGSTGQPFIPETFQAVEYLKRIPNQRLTISVDGGVNLSNIRQLALAGADYFVSSSAIYRNHNWAQNYQALIEAVKWQLSN